MDPKTTGDRIKRARIASGYPSAADLARYLKVSRATVSSWEVGKSIPHGKRLEMLVDAVKKPADWLLYGTEETRKRHKNVRDRLLELFDEATPDVQEMMIKLSERLVRRDQ